MKWRANSPVLIVEDNADTSELETRVLKRNGFQVICVGTAGEAIDLLKQESFSAVLLDYRLPDGVCWPVMDAVNTFAGRTPVIVVTALGDERVAIEAMRRGAADYIVKSNDFWEELPENVKRAIKQRDTECKLEDTNLRLQAAVQASNTGLWDWNIQTNEVIYSKEWKSQLGCEEHGMSNHVEEWNSRMHPDDRDAVLAGISAHLSGSTEIFECEHRLRHTDGTYRWILSRGTAIRGEEGKPLRMLGSHVDITARKQVDAALHESDKNFRQFAENVRDIFFICGPGGSPIYFINAAYERIWDRSCESLYREPLSWMSAIHPEDRGRIENLSKSSLDGCEAEFRIVRPDKSIRWIRARTSTTRNEKEDITRIVGIASDQTNQKNTENQLRQAQKMEAIGQLAGGVAHDFNNLLTIINGHSELLLARTLDEKLRRPLAMIRKAGERAAGLTRQLLAFSRKQVLEPKIIDLNQIIHEMEKLLTRLIPEDIDMLTVLDPFLKQLKADPGQIEQVIMNLIVNSRDAMPGGGKLTIETRNIELTSEYSRFHSEVLPGQYVMLSVSDTGHGIDAATRARIFEPFFTTKEQGKGTGLGLSTVFGIVKQSNGHIDVYSEVGKGTTFKIYLPQAGVAAPSGNDPVQSAVAGGKESVLIVEDEEGVRDLLREMLSSNGYSILLASNGKEALQLCEDTRNIIDLIITDVVMPEMGGPELAGRIRTIRPNIKVMFVSGYTDQAIVRNGQLTAGANFLQKPFTPLGLVRKVRECLDASGDSKTT